MTEVIDRARVAVTLRRLKEGRSPVYRQAINDALAALLGADCDSSDLQPAQPHAPPTDASALAEAPHALEIIKNELTPKDQPEFERWQEIVRREYEDDAPAFVQRMAAVFMHHHRRAVPR